MMSTMTAKSFVFGSNIDAFGKPSSKFKFGTVSVSVAYMDCRHGLISIVNC